MDLSCALFYCPSKKMEDEEKRCHYTLYLSDKRKTELFWWVFFCFSSSFCAYITHFLKYQHFLFQVWADNLCFCAVGKSHAVTSDSDTASHFTSLHPKEPFAIMPLERMQSFELKHHRHQWCLTTSLAHELPPYNGTCPAAPWWEEIINSAEGSVKL